MLVVHFDPRNFQAACREVVANGNCLIAIAHHRTNKPIEDLVWAEIINWLASTNTGFGPASIEPFLEVAHPLAFDEVVCVIHYSHGATVHPQSRDLSVNVATMSQPLNISFFSFC